MSLPAANVKAGNVASAAAAGNGNVYGARVGRVNIAAVRRAIPADASVGAGAAAGGAGVAAEGAGVVAEGAGVTSFAAGVASFFAGADIARKKANVEGGFRSLTDEHKSLYRSDLFYEFIQNLATAIDGSGDEIPLEMLEKQMIRDIERNPISINGLDLPEGKRWTKDTLLTKLQSILGDGWERWKDVMYTPFCLTLSQTIVAQGMIHFSQHRLNTNFVLDPIKICEF